MATSHCGPIDPRVKDLIGKRSGMLTVVEYAGFFAPESCRHKNHMWKCACECGRTAIFSRIAIQRQYAISCGCFRRKKHGLTKHPLYRVWANMINRCERPLYRDYPRYGGRGIRVCERWLVFQNFFTDMGDRPHGCSLDRIDNNKGYCKENCRWATKRQQDNNRRTTKFLTHGGQSLSTIEWSRLIGISYDSLRRRLRDGWSVEMALNTPIDVRYRKK